MQIVRHDIVLAFASNYKRGRILRYIESVLDSLGKPRNKNQFTAADIAFTYLCSLSSNRSLRKEIKNLIK